MSWKVTLTAELFGGNSGVGYVLNVARQEFDTETIFAVILFILLFVAFTEVFIFRPLQRRLDVLVEEPPVNRRIFSSWRLKLPG